MELADVAGPQPTPLPAETVGAVVMLLSPLPVNNIEEPDIANAEDQEIRREFHEANSGVLEMDHQRDPDPSFDLVSGSHHGTQGCSTSSRVDECPTGSLPSSYPGSIEALRVTLKSFLTEKDNVSLIDVISNTRWRKDETTLFLLQKWALVAMDYVNIKHNDGAEDETIFIHRGLKCTDFFSRSTNPNLD